MYLSTMAKGMKRESSGAPELTLRNSGIYPQGPEIHTHNMHVDMLISDEGTVL